MPPMSNLKNLLLFIGCLGVPSAVVVTSERAATSRMLAATDAASSVPIASIAEDAYCTAQLKQVVRRVATAC